LAVTGISLAGDPVNNYQNSVAIRFSVINSGAMMGTIFMFAGNYDLSGTLATDGGYLSIVDNMELFSLMGTTFGGDGTSNFQLPDLVGRTPYGAYSTPVGTALGTATYEVTNAEVPVAMGGGGAPIQNMQPSLGVYAMVATTGVPSSYSSSGAYERPYVGQVMYSTASAYAYEHRHHFQFSPADGGWVLKSEHGDLEAAIGDTYGTASNPDFLVLPDLSDRVAFGDGLGSALGAQSGNNETYLQTVNMPSPVLDGAPYSNKQAGLSLRYLICVDGIFAPMGPGPTPGEASQGFIGQIMLYAGDGPIPDGWVLADGSLLSVSQNQELFYVLGHAYGGSGQTFALPDLVTYIPIGSGGDLYSGDKFGTNFVALTPSQVPEPGTAALLGLGLAGLLGARRRRVKR
jgi:microcystin-dependent protein